MSLKRVIRCLLCRGNDPGSPVDQSRVSSDAEAVPLVILQANPSAAQTVNSLRSTRLPPSLDDEHLDAPIEHQQDHPPMRVSRSPGGATSSPHIPSRFHGHIQEASINHVGGHYFDNRRITHTHSSPDPAGDPGGLGAESRRLLDELGKQSSLGAVSYAEARADAGRCHPGTRAKALTNLEMWSSGEGPWKDVKLLVLTGPAGHGKSSIMQTFADRLLEKAKTSATCPVISTFFFKSTVPEQNQPKALITTLTHQIAGKWPDAQPRIIAAIRGDTGIFSASLEYQRDQLLVASIADSHITLSSSRIVICAVDGLDECSGIVDGDMVGGSETTNVEKMQSRVIRLLHALSRPPNVRVVISSRPEVPIERAIERGMADMLHIDLNEDYNAAEDIFRFTWDRLKEIRKEILPNVDPASWPRKEDAEQIADYSSGQFILADTAMRYVNDRRYDPRKRLKQVLVLCGGASDPRATKPGTTSRGPSPPLGVLDALFTGILQRAARNAYPDLEPEPAVLELASLVWTVIGLVPSRIEASAHSGESISLWVIKEVIDRQSGGLARELSDLHSLLDVPQDMRGERHNKVSAHHKSFLDFLGDPGRSGHLGNVAHVAEERFDQMIKDHLSSLTVNDLKSLVLAQHVRPHILHFLHLLSKPETFIESIGPKVWKALLPTLNAWEMLLVKQWVFVGLSNGQLLWDFRNSKMLQMVDDASKKTLHDLLPGLENQGPPYPPPISDRDIEHLLATLDGQGDENSGCESSEFVPKYRTTRRITGVVASFPWFPAARALAWLWAPSHRLITDVSRVTRPPDTNNPHPPEPSHIVFITGSAGSGKRELLEEAYGFLPAGRLLCLQEGWMPPVDIIIVPDTDGMSLRSLWIPGSVGEYYSTVPCNNTDLTGKIQLSHQMSPSLFQDWVKCWRAKHEKNTYHPQFLLQGLHLLSPEHQAALLEVISSHAGQSDTLRRPPLFITVTSLPTATLAGRLRQFSWPGVYYVNLNAVKADISLLEDILFEQVQSVPPVPPLKIHKLARILATSPKPAHHLKRLLDHRKYNRGGWENRLDPILAAPESEAWRLIEEHLGDIPSDDEGGESGEDDWESEED